MVIYTKLVTDGTTRHDAKNINLRKTTGEQNSTSFFSVDLDNDDGRNKNNFSIGDEVEIYAEQNLLDGNGYFAGGTTGALVATTDKLLFSTDGTAMLAWTAPGDNGYTGMIASGTFFIQYSTSLSNFPLWFFFFTSFFITPPRDSGMFLLEMLALSTG